MNIFESIFSGFIQGLTEFFPISSSAHLVFFHSLLDIKNGQVFFDIILHIATLFAIIIFFRQDIVRIIKNFYKIKQIKTNQETKIFWLVVISSIPTAIIGFIFHDKINEIFFQPSIVAILLIITGIFLFSTRYIKRFNKDIFGIKISEVLLVGLAQGIALLPGISRSGITISVALFLGWERELAFKYSFILAIPATLGALLLEIVSGVGEITYGYMNYFIGGIISLIVGFFALKFLSSIVQKGNIFKFSYYCWVLGLVMLIIFSK